ncbi:recombinase family protein [Stappia sp. F7233]|uniref:Recombinase family protein n=1 Tax=Stappia albiluteola TaxID=2758565 RepID=A0A839A8T0_9HYPH|nr:recombinase family protein [Stappia albiluteola]MBA5775990.1 recombinase family protein [Stappia albiluteola]MBA5776000.1 recombinase family protein [Stappia albiluteola]MBA5776003.1 recombinase family protein [Stappia albiluteola]
MRAAIYARVSTDKSQTVENQIRELRQVGERLGWEIVTVFSDEGISGAKGRDQRPGFDALMRAVTRREIDLIGAWAVDRLGRSLSDLVGFLNEIQSRGVDLYLHQQGLDTSTPSGRMLFQMLSVFSEFEREMIRSRVVAGLRRTAEKGTRLGRPPVPPHKMDAIRKALEEGRGVRATARRFDVSPTTVSRVKAELDAVA